MGTDGNGGFCAWASDVVGFRLTLPTEAQFEYASRGSQVGVAYPWGDVFDAAKVWCGGSETTEPRSTVSVFRIRDQYINSFGLIDMSGNVFQWCSDWYGGYLKSSKEDSDATRSSRLYRCVRGGSWDADYPEGFRCANRYGFSPNDWGIYTGFRLVAGPG